MEKKIQNLLFPLEADSDGWPPVGAESIAVEVQSTGSFCILTPPLFIKGLSVRDLISVEFGDDGTVVDWQHVERSANSTVWVLQGSAPSLSALSTFFLESKCNVERFSEIGLFSVDVPPSVSEPALDRIIDKCRTIGGHVAVPSFRFDEPGITNT